MRQPVSLDLRVPTCRAANMPLTAEDTAITIPEAVAVVAHLGIVITRVATVVVMVGKVRIMKMVVGNVVVPSGAVVATGDHHVVEEVTADLIVVVPVAHEDLLQALEMTRKEICRDKTIVHASLDFIVGITVPDVGMVLPMEIEDQLRREKVVKHEAQENQTTDVAVGPRSPIIGQKVKMIRVGRRIKTPVTLPSRAVNSLRHRK